MTSPNPYIERGIVPSEKEWGIMQEALAGLVRYYEASNMKDDAALAVDMLRRYGQVVAAGTGLTDDVLARYQKRIFVALRKGDMPGFRQAYADMFATAIRLAPDPAENCGSLLMQILLSAQAAKALEMCAGPLLGRVVHEIRSCREDIKAGIWSPDQDVLDYLESWIEVGFRNASRGLEPWPDAPDDTSEVAPASPGEGETP